MVIPALLAFVAFLMFWWLWDPGVTITDGRHDLGRNAIWIQHGWLGDDGWFKRTKNEGRKAEFRSRERVRALADRLRRHHITDVYPHLCPARPDGRLPGVDDEQVRMFLEEFEGFRVLPWVGGVRDETARIKRAAWRQAFSAEVAALLETYPALAGVHLNIEPCRSGDADFLALLDELRGAMPQDKLLSVAAYPPPTVLHRFPNVHWDEAMYREVARRVDQLAVMMYDTAVRRRQLYRWLMSSWTEEVLCWSGGADVLLGLPVYDDAGVGYHDPQVENLPNALAGIHAGLVDFGQLPPNYQGVAIYCEWEMDQDEWATLGRHFLKSAEKP